MLTLWEVGAIRCACRDGFTMIELIVGLAIVVMLAAVVTPAVTSTIDRQRVDNGAKMLAEIAAGFPPFWQATDDNPGRLSHLTNAINTTQYNSCNGLYDLTDVANWNGPYYKARVITAGGSLPVFIGTARDLLERAPVDVTPGVLKIYVDGVREEDLLALDRRIDASNGPTVGTIQWWAANADGTHTMMYNSPVRGC